MESSTFNDAVPPDNSPKNDEVATTTRNPLSPVFWQPSDSYNESDSSVERSHGRSQIQLEDNTEETSDHSKALWAESVSIDDYVIVSGAMGGFGAYVVWNCTVQILDVGPPLS